MEASVIPRHQPGGAHDIAQRRLQQRHSDEAPSQPHSVQPPDQSDQPHKVEHAPLCDKNFSREALCSCVLRTKDK
jgi:hypothetical protein